MMDDADLPQYARKIQHMMAKTLLKQSDVAREAGIARDAFGRYFHGKNRPPPAKVAAIARVLGCKPSDIDPQVTADLPEEEKHDDAPAYMTSPARNGDPSMMRIKVDADLSSETVIEIMNLINKEKLRTMSQ